MRRLFPIILILALLIPYRVSANQFVYTISGGGGMLASDYNPEDTEPLPSQIAFASDLIGDGTDAGQMMWWDGSAWVPATGVSWDEANLHIVGTSRFYHSGGQYLEFIPSAGNHQIITSNGGFNISSASGGTRYTTGGVDSLITIDPASQITADGIVLRSNGFSFFMGGNVGINVRNPSGIFEVRNTTGPQVTGSYDASNLFTMEADASGDLTIAATGGDIALSENTTVGSGEAGVDYTLTFDGDLFDGLMTWAQADDTLVFADNIKTERNTEIAGTMSTTSVLRPPSLSGATNNWAPAGYTDNRIWIMSTTGANVNVSGIQAAPWLVITLIHDQTAGNIILVGNSGLSAVGNQFLFGSKTMQPGEAVTIWCDGALGWRAMSDQL